mgnify:FL=1|jgi:deazaflavin-dependent oxidoreductase (nitroreductase family)
MTDLTTVATLEHCSLTTTGRRTHRAHTTEIWFALDGGRVYVLASNGDRSDWLRDLRERPTVGIRIGDHDFVATARVVEDAEEDRRARRLLADKYAEREPDASWPREAVAVAVELPPVPGVVPPEARGA